MNILVTGGRGFIGRKLISKLVKEGHYIVSLDRTNYPNTKVEGANYLSLDIKDIGKLSMSNIDVVYHLAAVGVDKVSSFNDPNDVFNNIVVNTNNVIEWCLTNNAKLVYAGSSSKYFNIDQSPYTQYKAIAEDSIRLYQKHFNLKADIATIYNVYGYCTETKTEVSGLIKAWKEQMKSGSLKVFGNGKQEKDFIHVEDVVNGLYLLSDSECSIANWHLGSGDNYSINDIFKLFKENDKSLKKKFTFSEEVDNSDHKLIDIKFHKQFDWVATHFLSNYIRNVFKYAN